MGGGLIYAKALLGYNFKVEWNQEEYFQHLRLANGNEVSSCTTVFRLFTKLCKVWN